MTHAVHSGFKKTDQKENIRDELIYADFLKAYIYIRICILN